MNADLGGPGRSDAGGKAEGAAETGERVLVIDDNRQMLDIFAETLPALFKGRHIRFAFAEDSYKGLDMFAQGPYGVVIVDLRMPGMNGLELLSALKETAPECEVIVHTAYADVDVAVGALNKGAFALLRKPCPMTEICSVIANALDRVRHRREARQWNEDLHKLAPGTVRELFEDTDELIVVFSRHLQVVACNGAARKALYEGDASAIAPPAELHAGLEAALMNGETRFDVAMPGGRAGLAVRLSRIQDANGRLEQVLLRARAAGGA